MPRTPSPLPALSPASSDRAADPLLHTVELTDLQPLALPRGVAVRRGGGGGGGEPDGERVPTWTQTTALVWLAGDAKRCIYRFAAGQPAVLRCMPQRESCTREVPGFTTAVFLTLVHAGWIAHAPVLQRLETDWVGTAVQPHRYYRPTDEGMRALARGQTRYRRDLRADQAVHPDAELKRRLSATFREAEALAEDTAVRLLGMLRTVPVQVFAARLHQGGQRQTAEDGHYGDFVDLVRALREADAEVTRADEALQSHLG